MVELKTEIDETTDIKEKTIYDLPLEVLSHIFSYLPRDIKVIRLVCSKWNESCDSKKVSGKEKILFQGILEKRCDYYPLGAVKCSRNIYNLQLTSVNFENDVSFWMKFGYGLRSLTLVNCQANINVPILQFCTNLNSLILDSCSHTIINLFRDLDGSFVQANVVSLTINRGPFWSDETMEGCFRICPHLRSLTLISFPLNCFALSKRFYSSNYGEDRVFNRPDIFSYSCIHQALETRAATIIELNLEAVGEILLNYTEQIASIPNLKLQKLNLNDLPTLSDKDIYNVIIQQPDLQSITINKCWNISPQKLADWIGKCSKLTRIEIVMRTKKNDYFLFDEKLLDALTNSLRLRELVLRLGSCRFHYSFENSERMFDYLHTLRLQTGSTHYCWILKKISVNLTDLSLSECEQTIISHETLLFICNHFTNLVTLSLNFLSENIFEYGDNSSQYSERIPIGNLKKLRTLRFWRIDGTREIRRQLPVLWELKFQDLRRLQLNNVGEIDKTLLSHMVENIPSLEYFHLSHTVLKMIPSDARLIIDGWKRLVVWDKGTIHRDWCNYVPRLTDN